jgi:hypothetical protein
MKKLVFVTLSSMCVAAIVLCNQATSQEIKGKDCFFLSSLHYTADGMRYWYSKENGGMEALTGIPYEDLGCKNCHAAGCDRCHKLEKGKKECREAAYSLEAARDQSVCLKCHGRERAMIKIDHKAKQEDVHSLQGLECVDCHSQREIHGDGGKYVSLKQPGAMDTQCENCHDSVKPTEAHTVHKEKVDCKACHIRHVVSCTNCHFDTLVEKGKRKALPVSGWVFLMNHSGKVTSASMQTLVTKGNKTFLLFAPHMSHSVMKEGRACNDCHGTETMQCASKGKVELLWLENGKMTNLKGVIPVAEEVDYQCVYQDYQDEKWVPIDNPATPVRQYAAFGKPLTAEQLAKLVKPQDAGGLKMK